MQTIDEARAHCRFVGKGIEKMVADGAYETLMFRFDFLADITAAE